MQTARRRRRQIPWLDLALLVGTADDPGPRRLERLAALAAAGDVRVIEIPAPYNVLAEYSIAVVLGSPNGVTAAAFTAFVRSADGQAILEKYGFAAP